MTAGRRESSDPDPHRVDAVTREARAYEKVRPLHERFTQRLEVLIRDLLVQRGIAVSLVTSRCKPVDSFSEKIQRGNKHYMDPLREVTDLAGTRVICYYSEDVDAVSDLISREFRVDKANSIDKSATLDPDRFGYLSVHFVVQLNEARAGLLEWKEFDGLKAEIQVRTLLQHAWAEIDHKLLYKTEKDIPSPVRRQLFRVSALLEMGDKEFSEVRKLTEIAERQYTESISKGDLNVDINLNSVMLYASQSLSVKALVELSLAEGFRPYPSKRSVSTDDSGARELVAVAGILKFRKLADLDDIIRKEASSQSILRAIAQHLNSRGAKAPFALPCDLILMVLVATSHGSDVEIYDRSHFSSDIIHALKEVAEEKR